DTNTFIHNRAISRHSLQCFAESRRRSKDVIEKSKLAKVETFGKPNSEKLVTQCIGHEVKKFDLISNSDPSSGVFGLRHSQAGSLRGRFDVEPRLYRPRTSSPCYPAGGGRE